MDNVYYWIWKCNLHLKLCGSLNGWLGHTTCAYIYYIHRHTHHIHNNNHNIHNQPIITHRTFDEWHVESSQYGQALVSRWIGHVPMICVRRAPNAFVYICAIIITAIISISKLSSSTFVDGLNILECGGGISSLTLFYFSTRFAFCFCCFCIFHYVCAVFMSACLHIWSVQNCN